MAIYTATAELPDGTEFDFQVEYKWTPPRRATDWEPAEGGVEIVGIDSPHPLTQRQIDMAEQECIDAAWDNHYNRGQ
jgi:hypothetical protein